MSKLMQFSNAELDAMFNAVDDENGETKYENLHNLMLDASYGRFSSVEDAATASDQIRKQMYSVLGVDENTNRVQMRKAIRRHKVDVFEILEETLEDLVTTGWQQNPFFQEFVDYKSFADGDTNEFYVEEKMILTVAEVSGNHHNLIRQRLNEGSSFSVKTSWYGIKF